MRFLKENPNADFSIRYRNGTTSSRKLDRIQFMTDKKKVLEEQKSRLKRITFEDWSEGIWMTPAQLAVELGNDADAVRNWILSCISMGPEQFKLNVNTVLS